MKNKSIDIIDLEKDLNLNFPKINYLNYINSPLQNYNLFSEKNNKCILQTKSIDRILHNLLDKFELNCFYKKNGCNKIILYSDFVKHCKECEYSLYKCNSPNCNFISIKKRYYFTC